MRMMSSGSIVSNVAIAEVILVLLLQSAWAQTTITKANSTSNTTITYRYNNKLTNITYTTTLIIFIALILFFLLSSAFNFNRSSANNNAVESRSSRRGQIGLTKIILNTFPTFTYSEVKSHKIGKSVLECAICLSEFDDDETLRLIPKCDHVFHQECIDSWFKSHTTCPVCRADLDETTPEASGITQTTSSESAPSPIDSRNVEATTIEIADQSRLQSGSIDHSRSPKAIFFYSRLSKSHSTGHILVRSEDELERFTLILPIEIRNKIVNRVLNRSNSDVVLRMESSGRKGYRSGCSGPLNFGLFGRGGWPGRSNLNHNTGEGTSRFMSFVGPMAFQKLGLRRN